MEKKKILEKLMITSIVTIIFCAGAITGMYILANELRVNN